MSWWYEVARLVGIKIESKEIERILEGEADPEERRNLLYRIKPIMEGGPPKEAGFKEKDKYEKALKEYNIIKGFYDALINNKAED